MKNFKFTYKSATNNKDLDICGYANIFGLVDAHNDIVVQGAFRRSLDSQKGLVKFLWQHEQKKPIGKINKLYEDE